MRQRAVPVPFRRRLVPAYKRIVQALGGHGLGRLPGVQSVHRFVRAQLKSSYAEIEGHQMHVDRLDSLNISVDGVYSPLQTAVVKKHVKPGNIVVDVGANIGFFTLIFARLVGPRGRVFAFEPDPENFELLRRNVELNGYENVTLVQKAVSRANGSTRLYLSNENTAGHRIYDSQQSWPSIEIEAVRLDDYLADKVAPVDFLKMDIEGSELAALEGMPRLLSSNPRLRIMTEFYPFGLTRFGYEPRRYLEGLAANGFQLYDIDGRGGTVKPSTVSDLASKYVAENEHSHTNLLCLREAS